MFPLTPVTPRGSISGVSARHTIDDAVMQWRMGLEQRISMSQTIGLGIVRMRRGQFAAARDVLTRSFLDYPLMKFE